jgi:hypothetical protein
VHVHACRRVAAVRTCSGGCDRQQSVALAFGGLVSSSSSIGLLLSRAIYCRYINVSFFPLAQVNKDSFLALIRVIRCSSL